ncbi:RNA polymerase sigma factor [Planctomycetota bacterium]
MSQPINPKAGNHENEFHQELEAFTACYETYSYQLYAMGYSYFRDSHVAEELMQEAFRSLIKAGTREKVKNPEHYLVRTVRNLASRRMSRSKVYHSLDGEALAKDSPSPERSAMQSEEHGRLWSCVARLPQKQREVIYMHISNEMTFDKISRCLQLPLPTVQKRYYTALRKLQAMFEGQK